MTDLIASIEAAFAADAASGDLARDPFRIPLSYEEIAPEWFTGALCSNHPAAKVTSFELGPPDNGSSNRRRVSLSYNDAGIEADLPKTVFCKGALLLKNRILLGTLDAPQTETNFFRLIRPNVEIDAPVARHVVSDAKARAYIAVMDDLTNLVEFCSETTPMNRARAESMMRLLAKLHSTYLGHRQLNTSALPFHKWADWWQMTSRLNFEDCCDRGVEAAESVFPASVFARRDELWAHTLRSVERHRELPATLQHTDGHFSNWYIRADDQMGLCDWQFLSVGHWSRDVIFALSTALTTEQRRAWQDDLLRFYVEEMRANGAADVNYDEAFGNIRQQIFSTLAFWTYTLRPGPGRPDMQKEERLMIYIGRMAQALEDLDAFNSFG
jgi:hypothetical protein